MSLPAGQQEDRHRSWRLTATVLAGLLAVIVAAACSMGGGGDDDDDDDDDDDSMGVVRVVGAGSGGFVAAPDRAATSVPTAAITGQLIHRG